MQNLITSKCNTFLCFLSLYTKCLLVYLFFGCLLSLPSTYDLAFAHAYCGLPSTYYLNLTSYLVWRCRLFTILFLGTGEGKGLVSTPYATCASATIVARQSCRSILVNCIPSTKISWAALFSWKRDYLPQGLEVIRAKI